MHDLLCCASAIRQVRMRVEMRITRHLSPCHALFMLVAISVNARARLRQICNTRLRPWNRQAIPLEPLWRGAHTSTFTSDGVPHAKREDRRLRLCRKLQRLGYSCTTTNRARWRRIRLGFQPNTRGQRLCGRWYFAEIGQREARAHTAIHRSCGRA